MVSSVQCLNRFNLKSLKHWNYTQTVPPDGKTHHFKCLPSAPLTLLFFLSISYNSSSLFTHNCDPSNYKCMPNPNPYSTPKVCNLWFLSLLLLSSLSALVPCRMTNDICECSNLTTNIHDQYFQSASLLGQQKCTLGYLQSTTYT